MFVISFAMTHVAFFNLGLRKLSLSLSCPWMVRRLSWPVSSGRIISLPIHIRLQQVSAVWSNTKQCSQCVYVVAAADSAEGYYANQEDDFIFEDFARLRLKGYNSNDETEAWRQDRTQWTLAADWLLARSSFSVLHLDSRDVTSYDNICTYNSLWCSLLSLLFIRSLYINTSISKIAAGLERTTTIAYTSATLRYPPLPASLQICDFIWLPCPFSELI